MYFASAVSSVLTYGRDYVYKLKTPVQHCAASSFSSRDLGAGFDISVRFILGLHACSSPQKINAKNPAKKFLRPDVSFYLINTSIYFVFKLFNSDIVIVQESSAQ